MYAYYLVALQQFNAPGVGCGTTAGSAQMLLDVASVALLNTLKRIMAACVRPPETTSTHRVAFIATVSTLRTP